MRFGAELLKVRKQFCRNSNSACVSTALVLIALICFTFTGASQQSPPQLPPDELNAFLDLPMIESPRARMLNKEVTVQMDNVELSSVFIYLSKHYGVNFVADKSLPVLKQVVSIQMEKVPLGEFFDYVRSNYDLQAQVGDQMVWLVDMAGKTGIPPQNKLTVKKDGVLQFVNGGKTTLIQFTDFTSKGNPADKTETATYRWRYRSFRSEEWLSGTNLVTKTSSVQQVEPGVFDVKSNGRSGRVHVGEISFDWAYDSSNKILLYNLPGSHRIAILDAIAFDAKK